MAAKDLAILITVLSAAAAGGCSIGSAQCENKVLQQVPSPDGASLAVIFTRSCGATTADSLQVSLVEAGRSPADKGNVLIVDGVPARAESVGATWRDGNTLMIEIPIGARVFLKNGRVGAVHVEFSK
jgi:hypothetical protein